MSRITPLAAAGLVSLATAQETILTHTAPADEGLGWAAAGLGDLDGDGHADYAVAAPAGSTAAGIAGYVDVRSGRTGSLLLRLQGGSHEARFGAALAAADFDGDGMIDLVIGAPGTQSTAGPVGRVHVYSGRTGASLLSVDGQVSHATFGAALDVAGDVNADGVPDILVGAIQVLGSGAAAGTAYVLCGATGHQLHAIQSHGSASFGESVAAAGDVNSDGLADFAVGDRAQSASFTDSVQQGLVQIFSGADGSLLRVYNGNQAGDFLGASLAQAGDVDGDGTADLIAGAPGGRYARVYSGLTGQVLHTFSAIVSPFGERVASAGDLDGDGRPDLVVAAPSADVPGALGGGFLRAYSGASGTLLFTMKGEPGMHLGQGVAGLGDVDGDGFAEIHVGAPTPEQTLSSALILALTPGNGEARCLGGIHSGGGRATLEASGSFEVAAGDLTLVASNLPANSVALMLASPGYGVVYQPGAASGNLCLAGGPIGRYTADVFSGPGSVFTLNVDLAAVPSPAAPTFQTAVQPGDTWLWQAWYRDGGAQGATNFTDAVEITFH